MIHHFEKVKYNEGETLIALNTNGEVMVKAWIEY